MLDLFYHLSGLQVNNSKCELHASGIRQDYLQTIHTHTGFVIGELPIRYLGVPLLTKRLMTKDYGKSLLAVIFMISWRGLTEDLLKNLLLLNKFLTVFLQMSELDCQSRNLVRLRENVRVKCDIVYGIDF